MQGLGRQLWNSEALLSAAYRGVPSSSASRKAMASLEQLHRTAQSVSGDPAQLVHEVRARGRSPRTSLRFWWSGREREVLGEQGRARTGASVRT